MKYSILILLSILSLNLSFAQEDIRVKIKDKKFYDSEAPAYVVEIPQATFKQIERSWPKYLKNNLFLLK